MSTLTIRRKELLTGLVAPLLLFGGFMAGEGALRFSEWRKFGDAATVEKSKKFYIDPVSRLRLVRPGKLGLVQINAQGFRGPALALPKPKRTIRLAFLGSSTTYDAVVPERRDWPAIAAQRLAATAPGDCRIEHLNAGVPGFSTDEMHRYFTTRVSGMDPDLVVVLPGGVTADTTQDLRARGIDPGVFFRPSPLAERSVLWHKLERNFRAISLQRRAFDAKGKVPVDVRGNSAAFATSLRALSGDIHRRSALPALVTISSRLRREQSRDEQVSAVQMALLLNPYTSIADMLDLRDAYNAQVRTTAGASGAVLLDIGDEVSATATNFVDTAHFSTAGSAIMGARIADRLAGAPAWRRLVARVCPV